MPPALDHTLSRSRSDAWVGALTSCRKRCNASVEFTDEDAFGEVPGVCQEHAKRQLTRISHKGRRESYASAFVARKTSDHSASVFAAYDEEELCSLTQSTKAFACSQQIACEKSGLRPAAVFFTMWES